jgi:hypothetical protein
MHGFIAKRAKGAIAAISGVTVIVERVISIAKCNSSSMKGMSPVDALSPLQAAV